ncbi:MAG: hypothetical protein ACYCS0_01420 [bacterium]
MNKANLSSFVEKFIEELIKEIKGTTDLDEYLSGSDDFNKIFIKNHINIGKFKGSLLESLVGYKIYDVIRNNKLDNETLINETKGATNSIIYWIIKNNKYICLTRDKKFSGGNNSTPDICVFLGECEDRKFEENIRNKMREKIPDEDILLLMEIKTYPPNIVNDFNNFNKTIKNIVNINNEAVQNSKNKYIFCIMDYSKPRSSSKIPDIDFKVCVLNKDKDKQEYFKKINVEGITLKNVIKNLEKTITANRTDG